jgi:RNA polymerase sigma-70 factor, ECF subfamily
MAWRVRVGNSVRPGPVVHGTPWVCITLGGGGGEQLHWTVMTHEQLELLVRTQQAMIFRYLRYMGATADVAEDVGQETFMAAYKSANVPLDDLGAEGGRCAAWLRGVARNQLLMHFRKARSNPIAADPVVLEQALQQADEVWATELLRSGDGFDYVEALQACLARLQGNQRKVLDMFYGEEFSRAQIAEALNMSEDGIKSLLRRVRAALRQCVQARISGSGLNKELPGNALGGAGTGV